MGSLAHRRGPGRSCASACGAISPGPYQIQAAISAVHSDAARASDTDRGQILQLYDQLLALNPTPVVALNRAVALAEVRGAAVALDAVDGLDFGEYYLFHAVRADLLSRVGRNDDARAEYVLAAERTSNAVERTFSMQARNALPA